MYNLLRFIKIYHFLILFILIESFSIFILFNTNNYQNSKLVKSSTELKSHIHNYMSICADYFFLKKINQHLSEENAKLNSILQNEEKLIDSLKLNNNSYTYLPAKVINNSINKRNNFFTLNKGSKHGINEGMGVITNNGVIGIIQTVSNSYSIGISLLHKKSFTSIKLKKNNHNGILKWLGFNYRTANIENFPNHIPIKIGDTITTNSHSIIFPENINVGKVISIKKNRQDGFLNTTISLFQDFNKINYVYVVYSNQKKELLKLEQKILKNE